MVWIRMETKTHCIEISLVFLLSIVASFSNGESSDCRVCKITRVHKLKTTDCYKRELYHFPKCLSSDSEVLELSVNRIRDVYRSDFSKFSYLKLLYLTDNFLVNLDDDVFEDLTDLTTLDLSMNSVSKLPSSVFQLPSLKSLYLRQNWNINIVDAIEASRPIKSPLALLDISQTSHEHDPQEFPDFGVLPYMTLLNISFNRYSMLSPRHFMGFCKLQVLLSDNVTAEFENPCDCWAINEWLKSKGVKFSPLPCPISQAYCKNLNYQPEDLKIWEECQRMVHNIDRKTLMGKVYLGIGISLIIALLFAAVICYIKLKHKKIDKKGGDFPPPAALSLLSTPNKSVPNEYTL